MIFVFGSAATGQLKPESDIDVAIAAKGPISSELKTRCITALALELERPIDLVDLLSAPAPIISSVLATGKRLLNREPSIFAQILRRLWRWNADMGRNHTRFLANRRTQAFFR